jgi:SufS family cysteine desulfurase
MDKISQWRSDFPVFQSPMNGKEFVFLDTASSAQKPRVVIDRLGEAYTHHYANIHRGLYAFSQDMTAAFEASRARVAQFLSLPKNYDVIFTRNTTESMNILSSSWGGSFLNAGDEIILSEMEHHANLVPWQFIAAKTGAVIKYATLNHNLEIDRASVQKLLSPKTKIISLVHISNALGVINPVVDILRDVKIFNQNIVTIIDGSQSFVHGKYSLESLGNPDFIAFTAHKLYGPNGVGVLAGRHDILEKISPYQGGGDMIETVSFHGSTFKPSPAKFEAGTPAICEIISLSSALDYIDDAFNNGAREYEEELTHYMMEQLSLIDGVHIYAPQAKRVGIVSFNIDNIHPSDVAMSLDQMGIAVRTGHHCCMPLMGVLGVTGTVRASLGLYSQVSDVDALVTGIHKIKKLFGVEAA